MVCGVGVSFAELWSRAVGAVFDVLAQPASIIDGLFGDQSDTGLEQLRQELLILQLLPSSLSLTLSVLSPPGHDDRLWWMRLGLGLGLGQLALVVREGIYDLLDLRYGAGDAERRSSAED